MDLIVVSARHRVCGKWSSTRLHAPAGHRLPRAGLCLPKGPLRTSDESLRVHRVSRISLLRFVTNHKLLVKRESGAARCDYVELRVVYGDHRGVS